MTNPTSNFGWQMPTSTDLVTDLPADFEVFGQAVDTDFVDLLGGTTGQVLSKTSNTDLDFTWVAANPGDITGVTAGTGISGGGTSGTVTVTNDMATTITAAGDIVVGTGSGTYDNLPIGTTAQVLTADTTVSPYKVKWATPAASSGDVVKLASASFSSVASVSLPTNTFSATYKFYTVFFTVTSGTNANITLRARIAGTDRTGGSYFYGGMATAYSGTIGYWQGGSATSWATGLSLPGYCCSARLDLYNFGTRDDANVVITASGTGGSGPSNYAATSIAGGWNGGGSAPDSLTFLIASGTMTGQYSVFGYNL
jgi:hypothetical protein